MELAFNFRILTPKQKKCYSYLGVEKVTFPILEYVEFLAFTSIQPACEDMLIVWLICISNHKTALKLPAFPQKCPRRPQAYHDRVQMGQKM